MKVPAGLTSDLTLPGMDLPSMDVLTLLGGADGLTTELPALETGGFDLGLPSLEPPDANLPDPVFITDVISPPEASTPPDVTTDSGGGAARPSMGFAVSAAGVGALGLMAFVL